MFQKKGPSNMKTRSYERARRLPERPPRVRTSQTRNNSSSTIREQISKNAARPHVMCSKMLFEFVSIANVPTKMLEQMKRVDVKSTLLVI